MERFKFSLMLLLFCYGCSTEKRQVKQALPPMPIDTVRSERLLSSVSVIPAPQQKTITLSWTCISTGRDEIYITGIQKTTDFIQWQEVVRLPYGITNYVTLTNVNDHEFYRAFNALK